MVELQNLQIISDVKSYTVDPRLYVKANYKCNCKSNAFHMAKLSMLHGFTKGVSVEVLYV